MKTDFSITIYLDTRRAKTNGKFPVKLKIYTPKPKKRKYYPTIFEMTEDEFKSVWETIKPRNELKPLRKKLKALEAKATDAAESLDPFTFEQFEKKLYRSEGDGVNVNYQYNRVIQEFLENKKIGTASTYDLSQKSIKGFVENYLNRKYNKLTLFDITPRFLQECETYMTDTKGRSLTTVSMYLRSLKAVFNRAIDEKEIKKDYYPFGKRKYQVPNSSNVKKALSKEQLSILFNATPENKPQEKARDFWFFSYGCNGINIKDIAQLRFKDIQDGKFTFYRAKTITTSKAKLKPVTIYLNDFTRSIIEKYSKDVNNPEGFLFDIISEKDSPTEQHLKINNFNRFIGQHLKRLAENLGLPKNISAYWARHSFATNAVRNGATMEFIQESLGHGNLKTTQNYFAGFDSDTKKEFSNTIMNFD
jgi:integrase